MDAFKRSTKQLAAKYKENLTYWYRPHYLRMLKLTLFLLAVVGSLALAFAPHKPKLFSTGPISANHARFEEKCEKCHIGSDPNLLPMFKSKGEPQAAATPAPGGSSLLAKVGLGKVGDGIHRALEASASLKQLDEACHTCHDTFRLHQPQLLQLALRPVRGEITGAQVDSCSSCHREHQGPGRMPPPPNSNCVDCHSNANLLHETLVTFQAGGKEPPPTGAVWDFRKDGVRRFVAPRDSPHKPAVIHGFEKGHPLFGYEKPGLKDPAAIKFNHLRHLQADVRNNGKALQCTDCHKPGADGVYMQPITYQDHCAKCHSLHFSADVPELTIPHHDPEKVRNAMQSSGLTVLFLEYAVKYMKITDPARQQEFIAEQFRKLQTRGIDTTEKLLIRVFRTGDPPNVTKDQAFPACAKCHDVKFPGGNATPQITPTNTADRWLTRGPFNHGPHSHMACVDCHGQAQTSSKTTDILMPSKAYCAACHRPLENATDQPVVQEAETTKVNPELTLRQLREGGVAANCQYCHPRYHAPADATVFSKAAKRVPNPH
jgi:hypothetical protein